MDALGTEAVPTTTAGTRASSGTLTDRLAPSLIAMVLLATSAIGSALVAISFHLATLGTQRDLMFAVFWIGMLVGLIPFVTYGIARTTPPVGRVLSVLGVAAFTTLPRILRNPNGPLFHDEFAHLRAITDIIATGLPGGFNSLVTPIPQFPGLHAVAAWISGITQLSPWAAGLTVVSVAHVIGLLGVYVLARHTGLTGRGATLAAMVYATNANWMYFESQLSYESLGLPLAIWVLVLALMAIRMQGPRRWALVAVTGPLAYAVATVHHLSSFGLLGILALVAVVITVNHLRGGRDASVPLAWFTFGTVATGSLVRMWSNLNLLSDYLGSPASTSWGRIFTFAWDMIAKARLVSVIQQYFLEGQIPGSPVRSPFGGGDLPPLERFAGYAGVAILAALFVTYVTVRFREWRAGAEPPNVIQTAYVVLSAFYFASMPFVLTISGGESAHRSWSYSMIGVGVLAGAMLDWWARRPTRHAVTGIPWVSTVAFSLTWAILLAGGVATGVNETYRFPEPGKNVSDLTAASSETQALGEWFAGNAVRNTWIIADRYSSLAIVEAGGMQLAPASPAFPYWDLYITREDPKASLVGEMAALGVKYVVVDSRMATEIPENGFWFTRGEPNALSNTPLATGCALDKFNYADWLTAVYSSTHYTVYAASYDRFNPYAASHIKDIPSCQ